MQAVILCGGLGTRLREETEYRPKPMVPIGGRPILWHIMQIYAQYGYNEFILALGYKGESIKDYFYHYELRSSDICIEFGTESKVTMYPRHDEVAGWKVTLVDTGEHSLKGSRIKQVESYITDEHFFVTYGDGLCDVDINALLDFHISHGKMATLTGVAPASQFGELQTNGNQVMKFREKPDFSKHAINGGFFVFKREFLSRLTDSPGCDLEVGILEDLAGEGELMMYPHRGRWACMDTLRDVEFLNRLWNNEDRFWIK